jgi:hypothetical protein
MLLQDLKEQVFKLPPSDRLELAKAIFESLQNPPIPQPYSSEADLNKRSQAIQRMRGLLKTDQPAPTDEEVAAMLDDRRAEKYL